VTQTNWSPVYEVTGLVLVFDEVELLDDGVEVVLDVLDEEVA